MFRNRIVLVLVFTAILVLTSVTVLAQDAQPIVETGITAAVGTVFTYQGFLSENGSPANGTYDFAFKLFDAVSSGNQIGSAEVINGVEVGDGYFTVELDFGNVFDGTALWLRVLVKKPGDESYTYLSPRQPLTAAPYAQYALEIPEHSHFGDDWSGSGSVYGLQVSNTTGSGLLGETYSPDKKGVIGFSYATSGDSPGVYGSSSASPVGRGVYGIGAYGVYGETWNPDGYGLYGEAMASTGTSYGVYGESNSQWGYGGYFVNSAADGTALYATGDGVGKDDATLRVENTEAIGGVAAHMTVTSTYATAHFFNGGKGEVLYIQNGGTTAGGLGGGDFIKAVNLSEGDTQFRVATNGDVYADGGYKCRHDISDTALLPAGVAIGLNENSIEPCLEDSTEADFAEMLPATGELEPGDVLAIGPDGYLVRSTEPYQTTIVGVYSTRPSFLGNAQFADEDGYAPLALLGVVPVKASDENGAIQPGDLLVASSTPGHAMKAGEDPPQGTVIGKALEPLFKGAGLIQIIVTLQ